MTRVVIKYRKIITRPRRAGALMVDRYSAYKAMLQVKNGTLMLVFCWVMSAATLCVWARAGPS